MNRRTHAETHVLLVTALCLLTGAMPDAADSPIGTWRGSTARFTLKGDALTDTMTLADGTAWRTSAAAGRRRSDIRFPWPISPGTAHWLFAVGFARSPPDVESPPS